MDRYRRGKRVLIFKPPSITQLAKMSPDVRRQTYKNHLLPILKCLYPALCYYIVERLLNINGTDEWVSITKRIFSSKLKGMEVIRLLEAYRKKEKLA